MCGLLFTNARTDKRELLNSLSLMKHRGPDSSNYKIINNNFMGHQRLKIIDLDDRSNQPFFSKDNRFEWMADRPNDWRNAWENWYPTRYQIKALKAGRKTNYIVFRKV